MSAVAVDEATSPSSTSPNSSLSHPNEAGSPDGLLRRPLCVITSTLGDAAILQQLIYLTRHSGADWIRISASDLGDPFDLATSTVKSGLDRLEDVGFLSSRYQPGDPKLYQIDQEAILEAIHEQDVRMTEAALMGADDLGYTCCGPDDDRTSPVIPLHGSLCRITSSLLQAGLLRQLAYLTNTRGKEEWVQVDAGYLSHPFDVATETVQTHLKELEQDGLISSRRPQSDEAKFYRLERDNILEAVHQENVEANESSATGTPREIQEGGARDPRVGGTRSSGGGSRDSGPHQKDYNLSREKKNNEDLGAVDEHTCKSTSACEDSNHSTPPPSHPDNEPSSSPDQELSDIEKLLLDWLAPWSLDLSNVRTVLRVLRAFGLPDQRIFFYVIERYADFKSRDSQLSTSEVVRYLTTREDLVDRGYLRPIESVRHRQQRQPDSDRQNSHGGQERSGGGGANGESTPSDQASNSESDGHHEEMEAFLEQCRDMLRDDTVAHWLEPLTWKGREEGTVTLEADGEFEVQWLRENHFDILETAAREIRTEIEEVELVFEE